MSQIEIKPTANIEVKPPLTTDDDTKSRWPSTTTITLVTGGVLLAIGVIYLYQERSDIDKLLDETPYAHGLTIKQYTNVGYNSEIRKKCVELFPAPIQAIWRASASNKQFKALAAIQQRITSNVCALDSLEKSFNASKEALNAIESSFSQCKGVFAEDNFLTDPIYRPFVCALNGPSPFWLNPHNPDNAHDRLKELYVNGKAAGKSFYSVEDWWKRGPDSYRTAWGHFDALSKVLHETNELWKAAKKGPPTCNFDRNPSEGFDQLQSLVTDIWKQYDEVKNQINEGLFDLSLCYEFFPIQSS